jgi:hypothetical protein
VLSFVQQDNALRQGQIGGRQFNGISYLVWVYAFFMKPGNGMWTDRGFTGAFLKPSAKAAPSYLILLRCIIEKYFGIAASIVVSGTNE